GNTPIRLHLRRRGQRSGGNTYAIQLAQARRLFLDYVRDINRLVEHPEFYNTLTTNCTTTILFHARASGSIARYNWKVLLSGYAPPSAYEIGRLDNPPALCGAQAAEPYQRPGASGGRRAGFLPAHPRWPAHVTT